MLLSARPLTDVSGVNSFRPTESVRFTEGDTVDVYFQLIDASLDKNVEGFTPAGRRFCPATSATLSVVFASIDDAKTITRSASQPFPGDASIWKVTLIATDKIRGTMDARLVLTEGLKVTRGVVRQAIAAESQNTSL